MGLRTVPPVVLSAQGGGIFAFSGYSLPLPFHRRLGRLIEPAWMDRRNGGIKDRFFRLGKNDRDEVWMPSEPGWPEIILYVYRRPPGEEGAKDRGRSIPPGGHYSPRDRRALQGHFPCPPLHHPVDAVAHL